jgi:hypothetical protein
MKIKYVSILFVLIFSGCNNNVVGIDNAILPEDRDWSNITANAQTTIETKSLLNGAVNKLKDRLKQIEKLNEKHYDKTRHKLVKENQILWLEYANSIAQLHADAWRGGSGMGILYSSALIELYISRIKHVKRFPEIMNPK